LIIRIEVVVNGKLFPFADFFSGNYLEGLVFIIGFIPATSVVIVIIKLAIS